MCYLIQKLYVRNTLKQVTKCNSKFEFETFEIHQQITTFANNLKFRA